MNMSVEMLNTLSLAAYIIAGIILLIALALFFLLNVPKLIGELSGTTAKKAIAVIRQQNKNSEDRAHRPGAIYVTQGKMTDEISRSGNLKRRSGRLSAGAQTEKLASNELPKAAQVTTVLHGNNETTVLRREEYGATTLLPNQMSGSIKEQRSTARAEITVDVEMGFTESSELIE